MGSYADRLLPRLTDLACGAETLAAARRRVCEGLHGSVVELGFGSGHNLPHYPAAVTRVDAVEPSDLAWRLSRRRREAATVPVRRSGLDGQALPFPDDSRDAALSTWTLCTIPDVHAALREVRRVLRPGAALHFVEHGLAPDPSVQRWQRRLEPVQKRVAGGCHLTRPVVALLTDAGFEVSVLDAYYEKGTPRVLGALTLGRAVSA